MDPRLTPRVTVYAESDGLCLSEGPSDVSHQAMAGGWVYIVTNKPNGTLYIGMTNDVARRAWEHREGVVAGFTKRYGLKRLVYIERHETIQDAIRREKVMKHWLRAEKLSAIHAVNPEWRDFYDTLN